MIGNQIANFRIIEKLGEGGMGVVFKAVDVQLDRPVAIKMLNAELARNPEVVERFRTEAKAQANLNHANLATLYAFLVEQDNAFMVMEYVEGETFEQIIRRRGPIPAEDAVPWFKQALLGVGAAHRMGIIHRDLKPSNLMLNRQGIVKVMDFGIAKVVGTRGITRTGTQLGTLAYMSPEQIQNRQVDVRSDIYALGVTLYEMLSGHVPFESDSDFQIMHSHLTATPPPLAQMHPYAPVQYQNVVMKALEKSPDWRYRTVEEFAAALDRPESISGSAGTATSAGATMVDTSRTVTSAGATGPYAAPAATPPPATYAAPAPTPAPAPYAAPAPYTAPSAGYGPPSAAAAPSRASAPSASQAAPMPPVQPTRLETQTMPPAPPPTERRTALNPRYIATAAVVVALVLLAIVLFGRKPPAAQPALSSGAAPPAPARSPLVQPQVEVTNTGGGGSAADTSVASQSQELAPAGQAQRPTPAHQAKRAPDQAARGGGQSANGPDPAQLEELEHRIDQLSSRAASVSASLNRLQQQQAAAGYGMRGDITSRQASMENALAKAQTALGAGDIARATRYADQAAADLEVLEHFLGR